MRMISFGLLFEPAFFEHDPWMALSCFDGCVLLPGAMDSGIHRPEIHSLLDGMRCVLIMIYQTEVSCDELKDICRKECRYISTPFIWANKIGAVVGESSKYGGSQSIRSASKESQE